MPVSPEKEEKFNVAFSNGALEKLKELAGAFDLDLLQVVSKGIKLLDIAKDSKITKEDSDGKRYTINVKEL